jgi:hypothetical protein
MSIISSRFTRPVWLALGLAASLGAHAQGGLADAQQARVDNRQERQETRIDQGVASGELTRRETARLERQQRHINRLERRTEADGQVTGREALRVEAAQDRASQRIFHAKHDRQQRPRAR